MPGMITLIPHRAPQKLYHQKLGGDRHVQNIAYVVQSGKQGKCAERQTDPGGGGAPLLSGFPEQGGHGAEDQADKQPGRDRGGKTQSGGNPLGDHEKADAPSDPERGENMPIFGKCSFRMGQNLHHGAVNVKNDGQYAAGDAGQNGACADQGAA